MKGQAISAKYVIYIVCLFSDLTESKFISGNSYVDVDELKP